MLLRRRILPIFQYSICIYRYENSVQYTTPSSPTLYSRIKRLMDDQRYREALQLFHQSSYHCNDATITLALKIVTKLKDHQSGIEIHRELSSKALKNPWIQSCLIHFYMKCHDVLQAEKIFSSIEKNIFVYGALFKGYIENDMPDKVIQHYQMMCVPPNEVIVTLLFNACTKLKTKESMELGRKVFNHLPASSHQNQILVNAAIDMFMSFGDVHQAENLFRSSNKMDIVTLGAMMKGYTNNHLPEKALDTFQQHSIKLNDVLHTALYSACAGCADERAIRLGNEVFNQMPTVYKDNILVMGSLLNMLFRFNQVEQAEKLFAQMKNRNTSTFGVMINGYNINEQPQKSLILFEQMKRQQLPLNEVIFLLLINSASQLGMYSISQNVADQIPLAHRNSLKIQNAMMDMWGKCGIIDEANKLFRRLPHADTCSYNCMINAYARSGMGLEAVDLYSKMPFEMRDNISHICTLNACSHSGLIEQAQQIYQQIHRKTERIVVAMVDCFGRMSMMDEARDLIAEYEKTNSPSLVMHMALLSSARNHRHSYLAETVYNRMKSLFPGNKSYLVSASILVSNTYASIGENQKAEQVRNDRLKHYGQKVKAGVTWTTIDGQIMEFKAHDKTHLRSAEIFAKLDEILMKMKERGYEPDQSWITRPFTNDESPESVLCGHSEKLAIAFNLIQNSIPSPICLTKNLRICGDCHRATKLIAEIYQVEIIARDANRIHHFKKNGVCSCQDYF